MNLFHQIFKKKNKHVLAITDGKVIRMENIPDTAFSNRLIGDGIALEIHSAHIYSPCTGTISMIAATQHAFTLTLENGLIILIHIGLNTSKLGHCLFKYHVKVGDYVTPETLVLTLHDELLKLHQFQVIVPIIILNHREHPINTMTTSHTVKRGKTLFTYK